MALLLKRVGLGVWFLRFETYSPCLGDGANDILIYKKECDAQEGKRNEWWSDECLWVRDVEYAA